MRTPCPEQCVLLWCIMNTEQCFCFVDCVDDLMVSLRFFVYNFEIRR